MSSAAAQTHVEPEAVPVPPVRLLLLGGLGAAGEVERVAAHLRAFGFNPRMAIAPAPGSPLPDGPFGAFVFVQLNAPGVEVARRLVEAHPDLPAVVIGNEPTTPGSVWFRRPPSATILRSLFEELVPRPAPPPPPKPQPATRIRWRRKGDMIIGHSVATQELLRILDRLAPSTAPVLVTGESGTGKELVARALHYSSPRAGGPFIALNCAAIPESLVEAELFGHQRGAFTGAVSQRMGAFEAAHNGTLFLDEIGEMPLIHQAKLLRVLETSEVTRLGSNAVRHINVRLVAATNRDLAAEVAAGRFREDLYYRLKVYPVHLEPLRNRPEDIPPIVDHHLSLIGARENRTPLKLTAPALEKILAYRWPGNVRELINVLERACLVAQGPAIEPEDILLPTDVQERRGGRPTLTLNSGALPSYRDARVRFETEYYSHVLKVSGGNISLAARLAHKTRKEVYDALKRLGLDPADFRARST